MNIALIQLSMERLLEKVERIEKENTELKERIQTLEKRENSECKKVEVIQEGEDMKPMLLDTKEVLKILGISYNTLQAIVRKKILLPIRINERRIRFTRKSVTEYINSLSVKAKKHCS